MGQAAGHGAALTARRVFVLVAAFVLAAATFLFVVDPALRRGGAGELLLILGFFAAVLLFERWLRTR